MVGVAINTELGLAFLILLLSFISAIISAKLRLGYTTILIAIGFALSFLRAAGGLGTIPLDNTLILGLIVPPVMFESSMRTRYEVFRDFQKTVWTLALAGVLISTIVSAFVLNLGLAVPLSVALTFGVIVAPTDTVTVVNTLRRVNAPEGLTTILEAEANFNNVPSAILYPVVISLTFNPVKNFTAFAYDFAGGIVIGLAVAGGAELLYRMITDPLAETSFTLAVMFGSYVLAESLGVSGLMAVAIAGLYMGNRTMRTAMSEETRITVTRFWEVVTFLATSFAFLLLGLKANFGALLSFAPFVVAAFAAILFARAVSVYPIIALTRILGEKIPSSWTHLVAFAGLRGVLSVALALSLPDSSFKTVIVAMTFGVALLSMILQGELLNVWVRQAKL
jgi:CPA1 family monovalent cation:H+ antiporter